MTTNTKSIITCVATTGPLVLLAGCCFLSWHPGCAPKIVSQPASQIVKKGTSVTFSVVTVPPTNVFYQWQFNGLNIASATSSSYTIGNVDFLNVGEYRVLVSGSPTNTSKTAYLSVYSLSPNGGTLQAPIGYFSSQSVTCGGGTFTKGYAPTNSDGSIAFIYGPNAYPQTGLFLNPPPGGTSGSTFTVDTFTSTAGIDTGLRIRGNWSGLPVVACNDDANPSGQPGENDNRQSKAVLTLSPNPGDVTHNNTYRLTLLYKGSPSPPATVTINWQYGP